MLEIMVPKQELFDSENEEFIYCDGGRLLLEHSLVAVSKWESKWKKPFLENEEKNLNQIRYYVKCMTLNEVQNKNIYLCLTKDNFKQILDYIGDAMTATWFSKAAEEKALKGMSHSKNEKITSEMIYYWMFSFGVPMECEKWHIRRLMTLLKIFAIKSNGEGAKMTAKERALLNEQRRAKYSKKH